jgi:hypothetical protein
MSAVLVFFVALSSAQAAAPSAANYAYACQLEDSARHIEVAYLLPDQKVPCEVRYQKNDEPVKVLWRAVNQEGFCESHAQQLVKKHQALGFECTSHGAVPRSTVTNRY